MIPTEVCRHVATTYAAATDVASELALGRYRLLSAMRRLTVCWLVDEGKKALGTVDLTFSALRVSAPRRRGDEFCDVKETKGKGRSERATDTLSPSRSFDGDLFARSLST
jgi:hypothetical protein